MPSKVTSFWSEVDVKFCGDVTLTYKGMQIVRLERGIVYIYYQFISVMRNESQYHSKQAEGNNLMKSSQSFGNLC
jgi:hypothetical protein